tara:strand:- start:5827 stop:6009 length:183 start_codon:yes stop_codon:yes gene_type:complete
MQVMRDHITQAKLKKVISERMPGYCRRLYAAAPEKLKGFFVPWSFFRYMLLIAEVLLVLL